MDFYRRFNSFKVSRKQQVLLWKGGAVPFQPLPRCMELVAGIQVQWDRLERQTQRSPRVRPCPRLTSFPLSFWTPEACYNHQSQQLSFRACALRLTGMKDLCHLSTELRPVRTDGKHGRLAPCAIPATQKSLNWVGCGNLGSSHTRWNGHRGGQEAGSSIITLLPDSGRPWGLSGLDFQH